MSYTKGPWQIERYTNYYGFSIWAIDRGCIAERWYDKARSEEIDNEMQANARLIAAAPDLLEACILMMSEIKKLSNGNIIHAMLVMDEAVTRATKGE